MNEIEFLELIGLGWMYVRLDEVSSRSQELRRASTSALGIHPLGASVRIGFILRETSYCAITLAFRLNGNGWIGREELLKRTYEFV